MGLGDHPETFLLKALCCQSAPSWLKVGGGWVAPFQGSELLIPLSPMHREWIAAILKIVCGNFLKPVGGKFLSLAADFSTSIILTFYTGWRLSKYLQFTTSIIIG